MCQVPELSIQSIFLLERVSMGTLAHILPILIAAIFTLILFRISKEIKQSSREKIIHMMSIFISLSVIVFHIYKLSLGNYNVKTDLPLYLCSFLGLTIPIFTFFKRNWMYEILLFWIIGGTLQAIITPDIPVGFPSFEFFRYWIVHLGLVVLILYANQVFNFKLNIKSVFKSILALQLYVVFMMLINYVLKSNYFYLNAKPESPSLLDYMGEWPIYIVVGQLILIPYFLLIYFPFYLNQKVRLKRIKS